MKNFLASAFFCFVVLMWQTPAGACTCATPPSDQFLARTPLVFRGTVLSVEPKPVSPSSAAFESTNSIAIFGRAIQGRTTSTLGLGRQMTARFKIEYVLKGHAGEEIEIGFPEANGRNCGTGFAVGQSLTVFADGRPHQGYATDGCMMHPYLQTISHPKSPYVVAIEKYRESVGGFNQMRKQRGSSEKDLREEATFYMKYRDLDDAEKTLSELLALHPKDVGALADRGGIRYQAEYYEDALADFQSALSIDRNSVAAIRGRARKLVQLQRHGEIEASQWDLTDFQPDHRKQYDFSRLDLRGASFRNTRLLRPNFSGANLTGADFSGANLTQVNFAKANLVEATFDNSNFSSVNFTDAKLDRSRFRGARLAQTNFEGVTVDQVDFTGTSFEGVNFRDGKLMNVNFKGACYYTKSSPSFWPRGFDVTAAGATVCESEKLMLERVQGLKGLFVR